MSKAYCCILFILIGNLALSQINEPQFIDTIFLSTDKIQASVANQEWEISSDKVSQYRNLPNLLSNQANIYQKSYGGGTLSTLSVNGGSPGHTLLMWNEIPISNPMLGLQDLTLIPLSIAPEISLMKRSNTTTWGSGAISGIVNMSSKPQLNQSQSMHLGLSTGSFGLNSRNIEHRLSSEKYDLKIAWSELQAENDFSFTLGDLKKQQTNASNQQSNLLTELFIDAGKKNILGFHYWRQSAHTEIPPTTTQVSSEAFQEDRSSKYLISWKSLQSNFSNSLKLAYIDDLQIYQDPMQNIKGINEFQTFFAESYMKWFGLQNHEFSLALSSQLNQAQSANYSETHRDLRFATNPSYTLNYERLKVDASFRLEILNEVLLPATPSVQISSFYKNLNFELSIDRNYRIPSLNDKYWIPGGNPNLNAEQGWSQNLNFAFIERKKEWSYKLALDVFNRRIDDWILWSLDPDLGFFSSSNIAEVWSRGINASTDFKMTQGKLKFSSSLDFSLTRSTNQKEISYPFITIGEQLIYTPIYLWSLSNEMEYGNFSLSFDHQLVGKTEGINESISSYFIGNIYTSYQIKEKNQKYQTRLFFKCNNLWNKNYRVIERRVMPGRNIELGINYFINKN